MPIENVLQRIRKSHVLHKTTSINLYLFKLTNYVRIPFLFNFFLLFYFICSSPN